MLGSIGVVIRPDDDIVEIGCGIGGMTRPIAERGRSVRALDVSAELLAEARRKNAGLGNVTWLHGDGKSLTGVGTGSADGVVSYAVFEHIPDPDVILGYVREMGRVLRPGGWAAFQVSNDPGPRRPREQPSLRSRLRGAGRQGAGEPARRRRNRRLGGGRAGAAGGLSIRHGDRADPGRGHPVVPGAGAQARLNPVRQ